MGYSFALPGFMGACLSCHLSQIQLYAGSNTMPGVLVSVTEMLLHTRESALCHHCTANGSAIPCWGVTTRGFVGDMIVVHAQLLSFCS